MSQDQRPGKVKTYSGASGKPGGVRAVSSGGAVQGRSGSAVATQAADLPSPDEAQASGTNWLVLILFVLGCAIGGGLFTAFVPL